MTFKVKLKANPILSLFLTLQPTTRVFAWTDTGHMLTAKIASLGLEPEVLEFFNNMTDRLYSDVVKSSRHNTPFSNHNTTNTQDDMISVATWPDNMDIAFPFQKIWHFSDKVVDLSGGDGSCQIIPSESYSNKISKFLSQLWTSKALNSVTSQITGNSISKSDEPSDQSDKPKDFPQDVIYGLLHSYYGITSDTSQWNDPAIALFQQSFWLRSFIHYLGDVHQPLHCATGCSKSHPKGDFGGNLFKIKTNIVNNFENHKTKVGELHLLWDLVGGTYAEHGPNWPLNNQGQEFIEKEAKRIKTKYFNDDDSKVYDIKLKHQMIKEIERISGDPNNTPDYAKSVVKEFTRIRDESWVAAKTTAYDNGKLVENALVSDEYLKKAQQVGEERVFMGGMRLMAFLKRMYGEMKGVYGAGSMNLKSKEENLRLEGVDMGSRLSKMKRRESESGNSEYDSSASIGVGSEPNSSTYIEEKIKEELS